jgi:hypothetical protein
MKRSVLASAIAAVALSLVGSGTHAQYLLAAAVPQKVDSVVLSDRVTCPTCTVEFVRVVTIRSSLSDSVLPTGNTFAINSKGWFYSASRDRIAIYDPAGRFVKGFGRTGDGPGEFRSIRHIAVESGDSLWVSHSGGRRSVFTSDGVFARVVPDVSSGGLMQLPSGHILLRGSLGTAGAAGFPLHLLRSDFSPLRSFGVERPLLDPRCIQCMSRMVAIAQAPDRIWVSWTNRLQVERWNISGVLEQVISIRAPWFVARSVDPPAEGQYMVLPPGLSREEMFELTKGLVAYQSVSGIALDGQGLILLRVYGYLVDGQKTMTLEVIDPRTRQLLARAPWRAYTRTLLPGGFTWQVTEDSDGLNTIDVFQIRVKRPSD